MRHFTVCVTSPSTTLEELSSVPGPYPLSSETHRPKRSGAAMDFSLKCQPWLPSLSSRSSYCLPAAPFFDQLFDRITSITQMFAAQRTSSPNLMNSLKKRVGKACDRCRLKKSECDGSHPCSSCEAKNAIYAFGKRKKLVDKIYPKGCEERLSLSG